MSLTIDQVAQYAHDAGFRGEGLVMAVAVSGAETGGTFNPTLDSPPNHTTGPDNGSIDRGLWQLNTYWHAEVSDAQAHDPAASARETYRISHGGTNWDGWSTTHGSPAPYKAYLGRARAAVDRFAGGGRDDSGTPVTFLGADTEPALDIRIGGQLARHELGYALVSAPVSYTTEEASQLTLVFDDNDYLILARFKLEAGPSGTPIEAAGRRWRIFSVGTQAGPKGPQTVLVCQPSGVMRLRGFTPSTAKHVSPTDYMAVQAATAGLAFHGEQTAVQPSVGPKPTRDPVTGEKRREYAWEVGQRLAQDRKMRCYESGGTLFFGTPQFLAEAAPLWQLSVKGAEDDLSPGEKRVKAVGYPTVSDQAFGSTRPKRTMSFQVPRAAGEKWRGGDEVWIAGVPGLGGRVTATVTSVAWDIAKPLDPVSIQAADRTMWVSQYASGADRKASDLVDGEPGHVAGVVNATGRSALDFVTVCLRQTGDAYVWGAGRDINDPNPDSFDCSGLVYWGCAQVGVTIGSWSGAQYEDCARAGTLISIEEAARTRGALLFEGYHGADHVVVSLGDGQHTIEARGTAYGVVKGPIAGRPWSAAGRIPGMRYS